MLNALLKNGSYLHAFELCPLIILESPFLCDSFYHYRNWFEKVSELKQIVWKKLQKKISADFIYLIQYERKVKKMRNRFIITAKSDLV